MVTIHVNGYVCDNLVSDEGRITTMTLIRKKRSTP